MELGEELNQIYSAISSRSADIDEKIARLQRAKGGIDSEQSQSLQEIRRIVQPVLGQSWTGSRAETFDEARQEAFRTMSDIVHQDYDDCSQSIESKIMMLQAERMALSLAGSLAHEASELLDIGEDAFGQLNDKINDLKRRLF
ncbi:uncharacterized protein YukE [Peribacillus deserti]|uniref:Uncharacterized protein YukE n=1 Tax=Peribacillus deserti TaxID=673318 RepID=A0ABS2QG01_9BACI|nr:DUF5082 family protein [Peribacillus deserti]MBM7691965.1 uncharacterized protein YukE [Peribacillus deserti]